MKQPAIDCRVAPVQAVEELSELQVVHRELSELRAVARAWQVAKDAMEKAQVSNGEGCSNDDDCNWATCEYGMATEHLEMVVRQLEGM